MTPSPNMKVRLVRCPRCRQVLAELPNISVYKCGGCGTILQAKHRKMELHKTVNSVTKIQQDSVPEEEEARSSNLDFPGPLMEESLPDKDDIGFQDEAMDSSSELSEYRSAYNGLCSSPEFSCDTGECSLRHDPQIYDNKLHDSDEDSTGGGNFSGEHPSSTEASGRVNVHGNIYLEPSTKVDQSDGEQFPKVWQGGKKFVDEVRMFYGCEDEDSRWKCVDTEHREGIDDNFAHLDHDSVTENEATSSNHDLTSPPEEDSSSYKDSRNVSNGLSSMPDTGHCQYEDSTVEQSVVHDKVKCCWGIDSKSYVRELHDSDGESIIGGNFSGEIPSSIELVHQGFNEFATEAKCTGRDEKIYSDQTTKHVREDVEFPEHEDQENGWPPAITQHLEERCNYNVNIESNNVLPEEARSSNHCLGCHYKEDFLPDKDSIRYHDELVDNNNEESELSLDKSISNVLLSLPEVKFFENKDTDESLDYDDSQDLESPNSELLGLDEDEDEESFLDGPKKVGQLEGGESVRMYQKSDIMHEVQNISEHENGLSTVSTEHREGTNNHVHLEHEGILREVAWINRHGEGINNNHVHLENDDISKEMADHDSTSPLKDELSLDKANIQFQDEHVESRMDVRSVSNDLSISPQVNSCQNEDLLMEESLNKDQDSNSLAPDFKRHDNGLYDLDGKLSGVEYLSGEFHNSTKLVYHETEELIPEAIELGKDCSNLNQPTKLEPVQVESSLQVCPKGDNNLHEVQNLSGQEETRRAGLLGSSATETVSHKDCNESSLDDGFRGSPTFSRAKANNPSVGDTVVASQVFSMGMPANQMSLDGKHVDRSPRTGSGNFGSASSVELLGDSLFSETSPERREKPQDTNSPAANRGYYAYDGSESSNDETDGQIPVYVPHSSRRKGKEVCYSNATLKSEGFSLKNMLGSEPEIEYWAPTTSNQHHAITGSHGYSDEFTETKSRILTSGNAIRLNEGGSSWLPATSRNLQANQRLRDPSVHRNNLPPLHPGFHSPDKISHSDPDKMDLLRTICELKDQLNRIQFPKISRDGRFPTGVMREKFSSSPLHYDHFIPGRERGVDLNPHGKYQWYDQEKDGFEHSNVSALPLSGEAAYYRDQVNCSCLHCYTPDLLLPHSLNYNDHSVVPFGHNPRNISSPLSSQNYSSYECLVYGHETKSNNQSPIYNEMRRFYSRDKNHTSKRHIRPVAGGSPFVTCYHCSETLQLPIDFLVFRKRYHQLRCNSCSKILKFSFVGGKHIVPYHTRSPEEGNSSNVTNERTLLVTPHSNFCQHGEAVSCSDDYGRSFCRSCSTEGEASVTVSSSGLVKRNMYTRMISSVSSSEAMEDRNMKSIMKNSIEKAKNKNKKKNSVETSKSFGTSLEQPNFVKPSSEIEELPPSPSSPLHRLMGYSSISQVLKGQT